MTHLIGIGGLLAAGKDTAADYLVDEYGWVKLGMSDSLSAATALLNPWIPEVEPAAPWWQVWRRVSPRQVDWHRYRALLDERGYVEAKRIPEVRRFLQVLGTEVGRKMFGENVWTDLTGNAIDRLRVGGDSVVITGIRYPNELDMIRSRGGQLWWIERLDPDTFEPMQHPATAGAAHSSENSLSRHDFDIVIENSTLGGLFASVDTLVDDIEQGQVAA